MNRQVCIRKAIIFLCLLSSGCHPSERKPSKSTDGLLPSILERWKSGDKDGAVQAFVETDWSKRPLLHTGSEVAMSEATFRAIPANSDKKDHIVKETLKVTHSLQELSEYVLAQGLQAVKSNDKAKARKYFQAMKDCGDVIEHSNLMISFSILGKMIKANGVKELEELGKQ